MRRGLVGTVRAAGSDVVADLHVAFVAGIFEEFVASRHASIQAARSTVR